MSSAALTSLASRPSDLPDLYEIENDQIRDKALMSTRSSEIASTLTQFLGSFARTHRLGKVLCETLFLIDSEKNLQRRPDVAFVSAALWQPGKPTPNEAAWPMVPDLAIEVNSPTNQMDLVMGKVDEYFAAGVKRVWMVLPIQERIFLFDSPTRVRILARGDTLEDSELFPGFQLPLADIFGDSAA